MKPCEIHRGKIFLTLNVNSVLPGLSSEASNNAHVHFSIFLNSSKKAYYKDVLCPTCIIYASKPGVASYLEHSPHFLGE